MSTFKKYKNNKTLDSPLLIITTEDLYKTTGWKKKYTYGTKGQLIDGLLIMVNYVYLDYCLI